MKNKTLFSMLSVLWVSLLFSPHVFAQETAVRVMPRSVASPPVGEQFTVDIVIENGRNVAGCQVMLTFDHFALRYAGFKKGDYFPADAFYGTRWTRNLVTKKRLRFAVASSTESNGNGTIATLTFEVLQTKDLSLDLLVGTSSANSGTLLTNQEGTLTFPRLESGKVFDSVHRWYLPPDLIYKSVAYGQDLTYFVVNAQMPPGPYKNLDLNTNSCHIQVHIPEDTLVLVFPLTDGKVKGALGNTVEGVLNILSEEVRLLGAIKTVLEVGELWFDKAENSINIRHLSRDHNKPYLFLLGKKVEKIKITMTLSYTVKYAPRVNFESYGYSLEGTWDLKTGSWATPTAPPRILRGTAPARQSGLSDWSPFQTLSPESQQLLLQVSELVGDNKISAFANAETWQIPEETALLSNYPNPFNPETWIPYQLAEPTDVTLTIYDIQGRVVRTLDLGHQRAGIYESKSRAAYWDGKNAQGEPVASGVYFYTLKAGDFSATRKLLIRK